MTLNLQQFCSTDESRYYLHKPFSRDAFSYATNGHVMVRVPRRDDIPEVEGAPAAEQIFPSNVSYGFSPVPAVDLPADTVVIEKEECEDCEGAGHEHDCPDCQCECFNCGGKGFIETDKLQVSVGIGAGIYQGKYVALLLGLPNLELGPISATNPLHFRFDGGEGLLMPRRNKCDTHIDVAPRSEAA